jgi:hypothetical protein
MAHFKALLWIAALVPSLFAVQFVRNHHMRLFAGLEGFSLKEEFSLLDSLPALSPGLGELEAFKLTVDASSKTNADRSVWLGDSLGRIALEYYSGKSKFDSVLFYVWTSDSLVQTRTLKTSRSLAWNIPYGKKAATWIEVVGVYMSRPRFPNFRFPDSSVSIFEEIEGKTIHVVSNRYRDRGEEPVDPDTSYSVEASDGSLALVARGAGLAIVNPFPVAVELRVIRISEKRWDVCKVAGRSIQVYRNLLRGLEGPVLAYTSPGKAHSVLLKRKERPAAYFWLDHPASRSFP